MKLLLLLTLMLSFVNSNPAPDPQDIHLHFHEGDGAYGESSGDGDGAYGESSGFQPPVYPRTNNDSTNGNKMEYPWNYWELFQDKITSRNKDFNTREDQKQYKDSHGTKRPDLYGLQGIKRSQGIERIDLYDSHGIERTYLYGSQGVKRTNSYGSRLNDAEESEWIKFKSSFSKMYATEEEESKHSEIWKRNLAMVEKHNVEAADGAHGYTMAINQFSDLTYKEFEETMLGYVDNDNTEETFKYFQVKKTPDNIDYRHEGLVTGVKNQGNSCGSCWAFSATGGIEGVWAKRKGELISVSEQQLIDCGSGNCDAGKMERGFNTAKGGIMKESDYPYEQKEKTCRFNETLVVSSVTGYKKVAHTENQLELALAHVGYPISIAVRASPTFKHYSSGIYDDVKCVRDGKLNHALLIVGYHKTNPAKKYWIAKNCWGRNWGDDGYVKIKMGQNICGVAKGPVYPVIET